MVIYLYIKWMSLISSFQNTKNISHKFKTDWDIIDLVKV